MNTKPLHHYIIFLLQLQDVSRQITLRNTPIHVFTLFATWIQEHFAGYIFLSTVKQRLYSETKHLKKIKQDRVPARCF